MRFNPFKVNENLESKYDIRHEDIIISQVYQELLDGFK